MRIVSFVIRFECGHCQGKKTVPGGQREYGEVIPCPVCNGRGTVEAALPFEDFKTLVQKLAWDAPVLPASSPYLE